MLKSKLSVIRDRKGVVIALRFVLLLILIMIVVYESRAAALHWPAYFMVALLGVSNLFLIFLPASRFETQKSSGWIFFSDAIIVTVLALTISYSPSSFLVAYFLSILIAASSRNTLAAFLATFVVTLIYGTLTIYGKTDVAFLSTAFLGRIILFFVTATFAGYLSEEISSEQRSREKSEMLVKELQELDHLKSDLIDMVSSELRVPATPMKLAVEKLLDAESAGGLTSEQRRQVEIISVNLESLMRLATNTMLLARLDVGEYHLDIRRVSLLTSVESVVDHVEEKAKLKGTTISVNVPSDIYVMADQRGLSEVVGNLLDNAIVHTPSGISVDISSKKANEGFVEISVSDKGQGIPEDMLDTVFDRFARTKIKGVPEQGGMGLGLSLCKVFVEEMGGEISVDSSSGKGCIFKFALPLSPPDGKSGDT